MLRRVLSSLTVAITLAFAGCLDVSGPDAAVPIEDTTFASSLNVDLSKSTRTANGVYYRDLVVGTGAVVANGQTLGVTYTGWLSSGFQFDSNVNDGAPYSFVLGTGNVIAGWHDGLQGARVGTVRQLIIPASMAYGPLGNGPIPGNAVIVFNVEIRTAG